MLPPPRFQRAAMDLFILRGMNLVKQKTYSTS